jgi:hypothetical protein
MGMRTYLRLPPDLELMGDCGAFGYVARRDPTYTTEEIVDYYEMIGVDLGVSVDHLIVTEFMEQRRHRYDVTLRNAEDFLRQVRARGCRFTPVGAVQGWDEDSYVEAAQATVRMGYDYIALGGLARSNTRTVEAIVRAVRTVVPTEVKIHIFGIARLTLLPLFLELGIHSVDSAAPLRQAWLSALDNYYTLDRTYAALRIPIASEERSKPGTLVGRSSASLRQLQQAEREALAAIRAYDAGDLKLQPALDALYHYDTLLAARLDGQTLQRRLALYCDTLRDRPWKRCCCDICRELGVEVIIFRGNNRNRRRGFHNLAMVRRRIHLIHQRKDKQVAVAYPTLV